MRRRVLLVDDDPLIRRVGARALTAAGMEVSLAGNRLEALASMDTCAFDVAIVNYFLGQAECGCDLIAPLRANNPNIRITILSGLGVLPDVVRHAERAGADVVASKARVNWFSLAREELTCASDSPALDLGTFKRAVIHGTFLVHRRNITSTARALGITRTSLQRMLRRNPPPELMPSDDE